MFRSFLIALLLSTVVCIDDVRSGEEGTASNGGGVAEPVEDGDSSSFDTALDESEEHDEPTLRRAEDPFAFEREPEHPNLPSEALLRDPLHPLAYVFAHARSVQRFGWAYLGGSLLVLLIAENSGPKSRKPEAINKLLSLCLSFYWSTSACLVLSDSCRNLDCDVAFWSLAVIFMFQGLVFMVGGMILNRYHFSPLSQVRWTWNGVIGCCFWLYTLLSSLGHYSSSGDFFLLAFPVDAFTVAFLLTCGRFLHPLAYTLPIISCFSRALNTLLHFGLYGGEWALLVLSGCALWSLLLRFMYPPERPQRSRAQARRRPKPKPPVEAERLLFELPPGAQDVSGLEAVSRMMAKDEDGDAAHEFFDATADGGFVRRDTTKQD